jgi:dolichol kinase
MNEFHAFCFIAILVMFLLHSYRFHLQLSFSYWSLNGMSSLNVLTVVLLIVVIVLNSILQKNSVENVQTTDLIAKVSITVVAIYVAIEKHFESTVAIDESNERSRDTDGISKVSSSVNVYCILALYSFTMVFSSEVRFDSVIRLLHWIRYSLFGSLLLVVVATMVANKFRSTWTIILRKSFHFAMFALISMFQNSPSELSHSFLLILSFVWLLCGVLEILLAFRLLPKSIHSFTLNIFKRFMDSRDTNGPHILSHVFLLISCMYPLILGSPSFFSSIGFRDRHLLHMSIYHSAAIATGIGDSFASILGGFSTRFLQSPTFGDLLLSNNTPDRVSSWERRTVEGTLAFIISFIAALCFIYANTYSAVSYNGATDLVIIAVAIVFTAAVEAFGPAIDNVLLTVTFISAIVMGSFLTVK